MRSGLTASYFADEESTFSALCIAFEPTVIVFLDYRTPQASAISNPRSRVELEKRSSDLVTSTEVDFIAVSVRLV